MQSMQMTRELTFKLCLSAIDRDLLTTLIAVYQYAEKVDT